MDLYGGVFSKLVKLIDSWKGLGEGMFDAVLLPKGSRYLLVKKSPRWVPWALGYGIWGFGDLFF